MKSKTFLNNVLIFIGLFCLAIINTHLFSILANYLGIELEIRSKFGFSEIEMLFAAIIVAPLLETLFCQYLLYKLLTKVFNLKSAVVCILIMSLFFSLLHWYNWLYVVATLFGGIILNSFYIIMRNRIGGIYSFLLTILFHALYNSCVEIVNYFT